MRKTIDISYIIKRVLRLTFFLCSFLYFQPSFCFQGDLHDSVRIKYFTSEDELSQVSVNCMLKDRLGFVWIGTQDGLNRFDGTEFKQYLYKQYSLGLSGDLINKGFQL